ncbi:MAG: response regulator [Verrucomicrobia bacterium]|nr:response regulator [Verrucomicrobiota bacterium]
MNFAPYPRQTTNMIAEPTRTRKRTLLVVDDDEGVRRSLQLVFADTYETLLVAGATEALEIIRHHSVDAAILDIRLSGMSGIELLEQIKTIDPSIETLMLTGYETLDTIRQAMRFGACDYLSKPFDVETMRNAVANAMERRTLSEEIKATHQKMAALKVELQQQSVREEVTRSKGEIYASVLHDINGPLTIIAGYIELIDMQLGQTYQTPQIESVKDHLRLINRQINQCVEISRRYLSFLQRQPVDKAAVAITTVFEDLKTLLRAHPTKKRNQLRVEEVINNPVVMMNGADLIQVLLNLTVNAFQSNTQPHEVKISGEIVSAPVDFGALNGLSTDQVVCPNGFDGKAPLVRISVEDNGSGIPTDTLRRIFEPFFTTKGDQGTGLGLSIVQRLVHDTGGAIHVHSEVGKGTTFHLYLKSRD